MTRANRIGILKAANKRLVLSCIRSFGPISQGEVVIKTRLSRPTVSNIVQELSEEGLVEKTGFGESFGGRSPALFGFNPKSYFSIGIEFEFPLVRMVMADLQPEPVISSSMQFSLDDEKDHLIDVLISSIANLLRLSKVPKERVLGIGLGLPGLIDYNEGMSVFIERIKGWRNVPIKEILESHLDVPVYIRNDVHLMSLIENRLVFHTPQSPPASFIYVGMRHSIPQHGIGMSIVIDGSIYEGYKGNAGFIGHITVDPKGPRCICGNVGCLETFVGVRAIKEYFRVKRADGESNFHGFSEETLMLRDLVDLSNRGDACASQVLQEAGEYLGIGIANAVKLFEIPLVVLGGVPNNEHSSFMASIRESAKRNLFSNVKDELQIVPAQCEERHYALGGCLLVIDESFKDPELNTNMTSKNFEDT